LIQSNQKSSQQTLASLPHKAFTLQSIKTTGCNTLPYYRSQRPLASAKFANALSITQATIVLIDFARSWSVDGIHLILWAL